FDLERTAILGHIKNEYDTALKRESILERDFKQQSAVVTDQAGKSIQYNILKREVDSNRSIYESLMQQVKETSVASAIRASNIRIIDTAYTPRFPISPNMRNNAFLGMIAGLMLGVTVV